MSNQDTELEEGEITDSDSEAVEQVCTTLLDMK